MKFSISNLCLSTLLVAVAIAWAVDRSRSASTLTPQEKLTEAFDLGFAMGSVSGSNIVKAALEKGANETTDSGAKNETDTVKTESKSPE